MSLNRNLSGCQVFHPWQVPADWSCVPLKERLELLYGRALKEEVRKPGDVNVFGSNGKVGSHNEHWLDPPGILVGRKGTVGAVHYSVRPFWPIDTTYYVRPTGNDDLRYLFHLLDYLPLKILNAATGVPGLSRRDAYALLGAFPGPDEQVAIASVLDAVDGAIDGARNAYSKAESLDHSLLHELLDFGPGQSTHKVKPPHWNSKRVAEVAEVGSGVTLGKDVTGFRHIELPYLRVANVQDGHLDLSTVKTVKVRCDEVARYRLERACKIVGCLTPRAAHYDCHCPSGKLGSAA
jgi:type I restriction enzyme, S subunit